MELMSFIKVLFPDGTKSLQVEVNPFAIESISERGVKINRKETKKMTCVTLESGNSFFLDESVESVKSRMAEIGKKPPFQPREPRQFVERRNGQKR